jgi:hypothetical protein
MNLPIGRTLGLQAIFGPTTLAGGHHIRYPHNNGWIAVYWYPGLEIIRLPTYPFIYILKKKKKLPCTFLLFFLVTFANRQSLFVFVLGLSSHSLCLYVIFDNYFEFCGTTLFFFFSLPLTLKSKDFLSFVDTLCVIFCLVLL